MAAQTPVDSQILRIPRQHEPDLETVQPLAGEPPKHGRYLQYKVPLGLQNDEAHWQKMMDEGMQFCRDELPPGKLSTAILKKLHLSSDDAKAYQYNGSHKDTRDWIWCYGLRNWKIQFDYDIQYLNRSYPKHDIQSLVLKMISE